MGVFFQSQCVMSDEDLQSVQTFEELLETLSVITSIPSANIKIIANGKVLSSHTFSSSILRSKIVMYVTYESHIIFHPSHSSCIYRVGSQASTIASPDQVEFRVKDDLSAEGVHAKSLRAVRETNFDRRMRIKKELANPYRFHDLETLNGFEDEAHARELLQLLSTDPGVLEVLKKHKWSVGKLCEMYPEVNCYIK